MLGAIASAFADDIAAPKFGGVPFGADLATAKASLPNAAWQDADTSKITGKITRITAKNAADLGGHQFDVSLAPGYYGYYLLELRRSMAGMDVESCEAEFMKLIALLEPEFGTFGGTPALLESQPIGEPRPSVLGMMGTPIWDSKLGVEAQIPAGGASRAISADVIGTQGVKRMKKGKAQPDVRLLRASANFRTGENLPGEITLKGDFWGQRTDQCTLVLEARRDSRIPTAEPMAFDSKLLRHAGSLARRTHDLERLPTLPEAGLDFEFSCEVSRSRGAARNCKNTGKSSAEPYFSVAQRWAQAALFDFSGTTVDRDDPRPLLIAIPIRMQVSDQRPMDFLQAPAVPGESIEFVTLMRGSPADYYPPIAVRNNVEGDVLLICQIQSDRSVLCGRKPDSAAPSPELEVTGVRLGEMVEAPDKLSDGRSSNGTVFSKTIKFRLRGS
jgi:hypothetical protein